MVLPNGSLALTVLLFEPLIFLVGCANLQMPMFCCVHLSLNEVIYLSKKKLLKFHVKGERVKLHTRMFFCGVV